MLNNETFKKNIIKLFYRVINNSLYFDDNENFLHFYIFLIMKIEIFKFIYNEINYFNYTHIYKRFIKRLYIFKIIIKLYKFIRYCLYY